jgi:hypothetical protein
MQRPYVLGLAYSIVLALIYGGDQLNLGLMLLWLWGYASFLLGLYIHRR